MEFFWSFSIHKGHIDMITLHGENNKIDINVELNKLKTAYNLLLESQISLETIEKTFEKSINFSKMVNFENICDISGEVPLKRTDQNIQIHNSTITIKNQNNPELTEKIENIAGNGLEAKEPSEKLSIYKPKYQPSAINNKTEQNTKTPIVTAQEEEKNQVIDLLLTLSNAQLSGYEYGARELFSNCIRLILDIISSDYFKTNRDFVFRVVEFNTLISNLMITCGFSVSKYREKVKSHQDAIYKLAILTSVQNSLQEVEEVLCNYHIDVPLFNNWASNFFAIAANGFLDKKIIPILNRVEEEVLKHEYFWGMSAVELYNSTTYRQSPNERALKRHISKNFQKTFMRANKEVVSGTGKIAIYSDNWFKGHSTHRTVAKYIESIADKYEFTLLYSNRLKIIIDEQEDFEYVDLRLFKDHYHMTVFGVFNPIGLSIVGPSNMKYDMIIYPDAGFDIMSTVLANMRIAKTQISMTGFPSSVFGGEIDYFISGEDVDDASKAKENYDERLVLLPGFGAIHDKHTAKYDYVEPVRKNKLIIGGCWVGPKANYQFLEIIGDILSNTDKKCVFRIFPGINWFYRTKAYIQYVETFTSFFNDRVEVEIMDGGEQEAYMQSMNEVDCVVDSYPWGGSNVINDCIHLCKPVIVWESDRWFGRIGPAMLRSIGLEEMIAKNATEYYEKCKRIIEDDEWRIYLTKKIKEINESGLVDSKIYDHEKGIKAFGEFIDDCMNDRIQNGVDPIRFT